MAIRLSKTGEHVQQGTVIFTVDTAAELSGLPTTVTPGSTCFVVETSKTYILSPNGVWTEVKTSGGGGGGSEYPDADGRSFPIAATNPITMKTNAQIYNTFKNLISKHLIDEGTYTPTELPELINDIVIPEYDDGTNIEY